MVNSDQNTEGKLSSRSSSPLWFSHPENERAWTTCIYNYTAIEDSHSFLKSSPFLEFLQAADTNLLIRNADADEWQTEWMEDGAVCLALRGSAKMVRLRASLDCAASLIWPPSSTEPYYILFVCTSREIHCGVFFPKQTALEMVLCTPWALRLRKGSLPYRVAQFCGADFLKWREGKSSWRRDKEP